MLRMVVKAAKWLILFVGGVMILLSVDVFEMSGTWWSLSQAFLMHAAPGLVMILLTLILWKSHFLMGMMAIVSSLALYFVFHPLESAMGVNWGLLLMILQLTIAGSILIYDAVSKRNLLK
jgi:hypothetical protein